MLALSVGLRRVCARADEGSEPHARRFSPSGYPPIGTEAGAVGGRRATRGPRQARAAWGQFFAGVVMVMLVSAAFSGCSARAFESLKTQVGVSEIRVDGRTFKVFTLAGLNTGEDPIRLEFASGMQVDFVVTIKGGAEVWRWSDGKAAITMLTQREIAPGELAVYSVVWDGTSSAGAPLPPGEYEVYAELLTKPRMVAARALFTLAGR